MDLYSFVWPLIVWKSDIGAPYEGREEAAVAAFADKTGGLSYRQTTRGPATATTIYEDTC